MARTTRDTKLDSREARLKLIRGKRYWVAVGSRLALGYRRTKDGYGIWSLRVRQTDCVYTLRPVGAADDHQDANGVDVLNYFQAHAKCRELAEGAKKAAGLLKEPLTVRKAVEHYLAWFKVNRRSYDYTKGRIEMHILPKFGDRLVNELTKPELVRWMEHLASQKPHKRAAKGKTAFREVKDSQDALRARKASANRVLAIFKAILNKAVADELVDDRNAAAWGKAVKKFKKVDEVQIRFLTEAEATRIINCCDQEFRPMITAALLIGARYGELAALRVSNLYIKQRKVFIHSTKTGENRYVPLSLEGVDFFKTQIAGKEGDDLVFTRSDGSAWGQAHQTRHMLAASAKAKLKPAARFYDLRHTYASLLVENKATPQIVSKLLGNSLLITLKHYAGLFDDATSRAVDAHLPKFGLERDSKVQSLR